MSDSNWKFLAASLITTAMGCAVVTSTAGEPSAPEGDAQVEGLEEVVVTAQRREENLQRAALAVSTVSGQTLARADSTSPTELTRLVPALSIQSPSGNTSTFFVRGVGSFGNNGYSDQAVSFNYDGIYIGRQSSTAGLMFDLDRVEVLKGPQGTLYGRNATGGAINVIPTRPALGENSGYITASYGNFDAKNVQAAGNFSVGEAAAIRIAGIRADRDGYLSDGVSDQDTLAVRAQFRAELSPDVDFRLAADYSEFGGLGSGLHYAGSYIFNPATGQYDVTPSGLDRSIGAYDPAGQAFFNSIFFPAQGRSLGPVASFPDLDNTFWGLNAELQVGTSIGTFTLEPAYRRGHLDQFAGVRTLWDERSRQSSVELRFAGNRFGIIEPLLGLYHYQEKVDANYTFGQGGSNAYQDVISTTRSNAAFARLTAHLTDRFRLGGGLRFTDETKRLNGSTTIVSVTCVNRVNNVPSCPTFTPIEPTPTSADLGFPLPAIGAPAIPIGTTGATVSQRRVTVNEPLTANELTYRLSAEFDVAERSLLYASFETGFKSGGLILVEGAETYKPEFIDAYTLGSKNRFFDNRLQLNLEAFVWKYKDQQVSHTGFDRNGLPAGVIDNVGASTNKGVELDAVWLATPTTLLATTVQYLDATFDSFEYTLPITGNPPYSTCPVSPIPGTNLRNVNCSGFPGYFAPKWTMFFRARQSFPIGDHELAISADTQYRTERWVGFQYAPPQLAEAAWQSNAEVELSRAGRSWAVAAFVRNIEDDRQVGASGQAAGGIITLNVLAPRTYGVRVSANF